MVVVTPRGSLVSATTVVSVGLDSVFSPRPRQNKRATRKQIITSAMRTNTRRIFLALRLVSNGLRRLLDPVVAAAALEEELNRKPLPRLEEVHLTE